jgi:hypothetical protein
MENRKAALIEIGGSHDECLYSQLLFLKAGGYHTTLICSEDMRPRLEDFEPADEMLFIPLKGLGALKKFAALNRIRRHIIKNHIKTVIFNTAQGTEVRDLTLMPYPADIRFYGAMHNIRKAASSFTQKIISRRVNKYFVLNDYLLDNLKSVQHNGLSFTTYYPIFFPLYPDGLLYEKQPGEIWIAIPGQVEYKRRDYQTLVNTIAQMPVKPVIRFFLVGKSMHTHGNGNELKQLLQEKGLADTFVMWDDFVNNATYHACISSCDAVMPLIHPGNEGFDNYLNTQISGAYNAAFAYKKPLLMLSDFSRYEDFKENAIFYNLDILAETLMNLPQLLAEQQGRLYKHTKWSFDAQADRYLSFISE